MSKYLTATEAIFICPRCNMKRKISQQVVDPNNKMIVCNEGCQDTYDPWRLPARRTENIQLQYPRPDESVAT